MKITDSQFDEERALYGSQNVQVENCRFDGPADGESALKESQDITVAGCFFNLRYPFWHDSRLLITNSELTEKCRAALWYTDHVVIKNTKLHGIKALRECHDISIEDSSIISPEFGWSVNNAILLNTTAESEYFMMHAGNLRLNNVTFTGKYSFQYVDHADIGNCTLNTKDAFWHSKNVIVKNSTVNGEYLGWYSDHLTLIDCTITGTQPFCYCTNLTLINCRMEKCDLAFEKSDVTAEITTHVDSIKNPHSGNIIVPSYGELIMDDPEAAGKVILKK